MQNKNRVVSRDRLLERVWGYERLVETRSVDVHVGRLRNKLRSRRPPDRDRGRSGLPLRRLILPLAAPSAIAADRASGAGGFRWPSAYRATRTTRGCCRCSISSSIPVLLRQRAERSPRHVWPEPGRGTSRGSWCVAAAVLDAGVPVARSQARDRAGSRDPPRDAAAPAAGFCRRTCSRASTTLTHRQLVALRFASDAEMHRTLVREVLDGQADDRQGDQDAREELAGGLARGPDAATS